MTEETPFQPGELMLGKYRVERILGSGGMGVVLAAEHVDLGERVAIKFLRSSALENEQFVMRFMREARAAAKLRSEHAVRVHDVGTLESGAPYMVMEYLEGVDVSKWLRDNGPMPVQDAAELLLQACEAVAVAHVRGIVHRDIKPSNLFVVHREDMSPAVKLIDFGISKVSADMTATDESDGEMTHSHSIIGSPHYMAPEQMRSAKHVDARADIWALGATLHRMVTGETPFKGGTLMAIFERILDGYHGALKANPDLPASIDQLLRKCLTMDLEKRYTNVAELAHALAEHAPARSQHLVERIDGIIRSGGPNPSRPSLKSVANVESADEAATIVSQPSATPAAAETSAPPHETIATQQAWTEAPNEKRRAPWLPAGVAVLACAVLAIAWWTSPGEGETAPAPSLATAPTASSVEHAAPSQTGPPPSAKPSSSATPPAVISSGSAKASSNPEVPKAAPRRETAKPAAEPAQPKTPKPQPTKKKPGLWDDPF